jgi:hypothetical protein
MLIVFVKVALQDCESLVTRLRQKDAEIKWMENKHMTTKALHVKVCECARVLTIRICACVCLRVWLVCDSTRGRLGA